MNEVAAWLFGIVSTFCWLVVLWTPSAIWQRRWQRHARRAFHYELEPIGQRPTDLALAGDAVAAVTTELVSPRFRRQGFAFHLFEQRGNVVRGMVVYGHRSPDAVATRLARAVGGRARRVSRLPLHPHGAAWFAKREQWQGRQPNDGKLPPLGDLAESLTGLIASSPGMVVSIGFEPARRWEMNLVQPWYRSRSGRSDETEGVGPGRPSKVMVVAWAPQDDAAAGTATSSVAGLTHRWPFTLVARKVHSLRGWLTTAVGLALGGATALIKIVVDARRAAPEGGPLVGEVLGSAPSIAWGLATLIAVTLGLASLRAAVWPNMRQEWYRKQVRAGLVPLERVWRTSPRLAVLKWLARREHDAHVNQRSRRPSRRGVMPYSKRTLILNSQHVAQVLAFPPISNTQTARTSTVAVAAPPAVVRTSQQFGPEHASLLGFDPHGRPIRVLDFDRKAGVFAVGDPGTGKTYTMLSLWAEDARARLGSGQGAQAARRRGQTTMVWFESKGEGADEAELVLRRSGYERGRHETGYLRLDVLATRGPRLDMLGGVPSDVAALRMVDAFRFAFDKGAVGDRAAGAMTAAFQLAMLLTGPEAEAVGLSAHQPWLETALLLMTPSGADPWKNALWEQLKRRAQDMLHQAAGMSLDDLLSPKSTDGGRQYVYLMSEQPQPGSKPAVPLEMQPTGIALVDAVAKWQYFEEAFPGPLFPQVLESPRNKLQAMWDAARPLWTPAPSRSPVSLRQIITNHEVVILNLGSYGTQRLPAKDAERLGAMLTYLLWEEIKTSCAGWLNDGRAVGVYADELAMICGHGSGNDAIDEMRNQGRAFGVQLCLATQQFAQLPDRTAATALGFGTRIYHATENIEHAMDAAIDLNGGEDGDRAFSARDIRELPTGVTAVRMRVFDEGQPPFTVKVADPFS